MAVASCGGLLSFVAGDSRSLARELSAASGRGLGLQTLGLYASALAARRGMAAASPVEHPYIYGTHILGPNHTKNLWCSNEVSGK